MNIATCKITLDTKSNEMEKRLFLSITYQRQAYQYSLGLNYKLTKEQFDNKKLKITKEALAKAEPEKLRAEQIIASLGDHFTFSAFKKKFKAKGIAESDKVMTDKLQDVFNHYIEDHPNITQGTIDCYKTAVNSITSFQKDISITDFTIPNIKAYIKHLKSSKGVSSDTTIYIYLRSLRALYNYAQTNFNLDPRNNPFGRNKITISSKTNIKKAINESEFKKLLSYKPICETETFAYDMFLISFGLIGMNIADIIAIKNKDISNGDVLTYYRKKTRNRQKHATAITVKIGKPTLELIKKHGIINPTAPNDYIFPFLKASMSEKQELRKRKDITKKINKSLKDICEIIGIESITTYSARHTIATMLMNSNTPVEYISKSLGHSSIKVTQNYLAQLSGKVISEISDKTTSFMTITANKTNDEELQMKENCETEPTTRLEPTFVD